MKNNRQSVETTAFYATMNLSKRYDNSLRKETIYEYDWSEYS